VSGWVILALLFAGSLGLVRWLGLRGPLLQLSAAALMFGCAGYALQGHAGVAGSPRDAGASQPPIPLTKIRHGFFGEFAAAEPWLRIAEALSSRGNTEDAVGVLRSAVRQRPNDPALWIGLGNALVDHSRGLTPASQFAYHRAGQLAPGHPAPPFFTGLALARSGERDAAVALWEEILASAPADAPWRPMVENAVAALSPRTAGEETKRPARN